MSSSPYSSKRSMTKLVSSGERLAKSTSQKYFLKLMGIEWSIAYYIISFDPFDSMN